jgi:predicted membrane-bound spermidine synthase/Na+-translocating ferredoxin:NAD+ oxidoreductase RnfG subunit
MSSERYQGWAQRGALCALGFFALVAQTLLFRAFLTSFEGHEFALGLFFSSWLAWLAVGALLGRWRAGWLDALAARLPLGLLLYLPAFLLQHYLLLHARSLTGVGAYETFPWLPMLGIGALANAPVSAVTGFLFTLACRAPGLAVARIYIWEALGSAAGGVGVTLWLAAGYAEESAFILCAALLLAFAALQAPSGWRAVLAVSAVVLAALLAQGLGTDWQRAGDLARWTQLLTAESFRGAFVTPQARYLHGMARGQYIFSSGAGVVETFPNDEPAALRVALLLAQKSAARRVLLVGPDSLAIARRLLLVPQIERVVWLHPDPAYPLRALAKLPDNLVPDPARFVAPAEDVRDYLRGHGDLFDAVLLNLPDATTLVANRCLTREFFELLKTRLDPKGVVGVRLAGGEDYLGGELVALGASVCATVNSVFPRLALKPGDESWLFASSAGILTEDALELGWRWRAIPGTKELYPVEGIYAAMPADRIQFQWRAYHRAIEQAADPRAKQPQAGAGRPSFFSKAKPHPLINTDQRPLALLFNLLLLGKAQGWTLPAQFLAGIARQWLAPALLGALALYALLRLVFVRRTRRNRLGGAPEGPVRTKLDQFMLLFSTGFVGMAASLLLMALYQLRFGALFLHVGLISALFMLGLTLGGQTGAALAARWPRGQRVVLGLTMLAHLALLAVIGFATEQLGVAAFWTLFLLAGCFQGVYVPLAAARLQGEGASAAATGAVVESFDNLGGALGGLCAGVLLLPVLGSVGTLLILVGFVAVNVLAAWSWPTTWTRVERGDAADRWARRLGYVLVGVLLWLFAALWFARQLQEEHARLSAVEAPELVALARELQPEAEITKEFITAPDGRTRTYLKLLHGTSTSYLINTEALTPPVSGHGGPMKLALLLRGDGTLEDFRIVQHYETPSYLSRLKRWQASLKHQPLAVADPLPKVDAVSGATYTTYAVLQTLREAGPVFAEKILHQELGQRVAGRTRPVAWRDLLFVGLLLLPLGLRWLPPRALRGVRWAWLALLVGVVGFWLNAQFSTQELSALVRGELPARSWTIPFLLTVGVPALVALVGNYYCGWLCPFGAAQELAGLVWPRRWRLDPRKPVWRWTRWLKVALLGAVLAAVVLGIHERVLRADVLMTFYSGFAERGVFLFACAVLALSIFSGRFWCRNLCPTGAFLGWLGSWRPLYRATPYIKPASCIYGVRRYDDLDCLQCDNCRKAGAQAVEEPATPRITARELGYVGAVVVALAMLVHLALAPPAEAREGKAGLDEAAGPGATNAAGAHGLAKPPPRPPPRTEPAAVTEKIREQIQKKNLSGHEAKYYKVLDTAPQADHGPGNDAAPQDDGAAE